MNEKGERLMDFANLFSEKFRMPLLITLYFILVQLLVIRLSLMSLMAVVILFLILQLLIRSLKPIQSKIFKLLFVYLCAYFLGYQLHQIDLIYKAPLTKKVSMDILIEKVQINHTENKVEIDAKALNNQDKGLRVKVFGLKPKFIAFPGQKVKITGTFSRLSDKQIPGAYNFASHLVKQGFYYAVYLGSSDNYTLYSKQNALYFLDQIIMKIRNNISLTMQRFLSPDASSLITTMLYGDESYLDKNIKSLFKNLGLSHVLVASGSNVSLLLSFSQPILGKLSKRRNSTLNVQIIILLIFSSISLGEASLIRATLMKVLELINIKKQKRTNPINNLYCSILILAFIKPRFLLNIGFQMSCLATWVIYRYHEKLLLRKHNFSSEGINSFKRKLITFSYVQLILLPFYLVFDSHFNLFSLVINIFFMAILDLFITWGLVLILIMCIPVINRFWSIMLEGMYSSIIFVLSRSEAITNQFSFKLNMLHFFLAWSVLLILKIQFSERSQLRKKRNMYILIIAFLTLIPVYYYFERPLIDRERAIVLDVGQGNSSIFWNKENAIMLDTGPASSAKEVVSFLKFMHIKKLNTIVISHLDSDHFGALEEIIADKSIEVKSIIIAKEKYHDSLDWKLFTSIIDRQAFPLNSVLFVEANDDISIGDSLIKIINPGRDWNNTNDNSLAMYLEWNSLRFMFPGDISTNTEEYLVSEKTIKPVDVHILSHHGSKTSSSYNFIKLLEPKFIINSSRIHSQYNHPSEEVLERLENFDAKVLRTEIDGSIIFEVMHNGKVKVYSSPEYYLPMYYTRLVDRGGRLH